MEFGKIVPINYLLSEQFMAKFDPKTELIVILWDRVPKVGLKTIPRQRGSNKSQISPVLSYNGLLLEHHITFKENFLKGITILERFNEYTCIFCIIAFMC